jgi:hypothetical protein
MCWVHRYFSTEFEGSLNLTDSKIKFTKIEILINNINQKLQMKQHVGAYLVTTCACISSLRHSSPPYSSSHSKCLGFTHSGVPSPLCKFLDEYVPHIHFNFHCSATPSLAPRSLIVEVSKSHTVGCTQPVDSHKQVISSPPRPLPTRHTTNTRHEHPCLQRDPRSYQWTDYYISLRSHSQRGRHTTNSGHTCWRNVVMWLQKVNT